MVALTFTQTLALGAAVVLGAAGLFIFALAAAAAYLDPDDLKELSPDALDEDLPPTTLSRPTALEFSGAPVGQLAADAGQPALFGVDYAARRDPVIGADDYTTERHARIRAFQQRETAERQARSFLSRGF